MIQRYRMAMQALNDPEMPREVRMRALLTIANATEGIQFTWNAEDYDIAQDITL